MQSLDDLELEHESGGIDDESYAELHDDYTARAAATIRRSATASTRGRQPAPAPSPQAARRDRAPCARVRGRRGSALACGARCAPPGRDVVGQLEQPTVDHQRAVGPASGSTTCRTQVNAAPDDYDLRLELADAYEENSDLPNAIEQSDAAITIDPNRPEGHAQRGACAVPRVRSRCRRRNAQAQLIAQALRRV